jgi:hypothetical protein
MFWVLRGNSRRAQFLTEGQRKGAAGRVIICQRSLCAHPHSDSHYPQAPAHARFRNRVLKSQPRDATGQFSNSCLRSGVPAKCPHRSTPVLRLRGAMPKRLRHSRCSCATFEDAVTLARYARGWANTALVSRRSSQRASGGEALGGWEGRPLTAARPNRCSARSEFQGAQFIAERGGVIPSRRPHSSSNFASSAL